MTHPYRTRTLLLFSLATHWSCISEPTPDATGSEVPAFQGSTNLGAGAANADDDAAGTGPQSAQPGGNAATPSEGPATTGGIATGSSGAPGSSNAAPVTTPPATQEQTEPSDDSEQNPVANEGASEGCSPTLTIPVNLEVPNTIVNLPSTYDGINPVPLVFAFHGAGRTNTNMRLDDSRTDGSELEANYVVAYMKSAGNGWDIGADYPRFEAALEQLLSELCIDTGSLFAFGHSSGAQFIVQMLGDNRTREARFAGVAPVASSRFQNPSWTPVPTLVIHGVNDNQRGGDENGASDLIQYTTSNACTSDSQPFNVPSCNSLAEGVPVNAGCVEYVGCAARTLFCNHDDPNYVTNGQPTNHGWPCFANQQIFQFFESLR